MNTLHVCCAAYCTYAPAGEVHAGSRILCLDGGGIRGLIQIEVLSQVCTRTVYVQYVCAVLVILLDVVIPQYTSTGRLQYLIYMYMYVCVCV